ncbi:MAG: tetratricopeptide repeat protein [Candidatus Obscuribacterales bacterium]|nr:tetratricopeptide repeat protein [Candidatus Obscuribacterales bacterium]
MTDDKNVNERINRLASNPETSPETLRKLAEKKPEAVVERVAENPGTKPETLEALSVHESATVRTAVSENQNTPGDVLQSLAADDSPDVRYRLAENPHTPETILDSLSEDENPYIAARAQETIKIMKSTIDQADDALLQENYTDAETLYRELLLNLEKMLGKDHLEVAGILHKLAATLSAQGKNDEALQLETRVRSISSLNEAD